MAVKRPAVFLDKDGTLIDNVPYNVDPLRVTLARGAGGALRELSEHGFLLVVVSNQPGIALG
ncbi:MAG TPA: HAD family hydrolase, partial [Gammaproteobacteria bacterium]|nr:HAD family hydrolase [Gammaproteobacteria bacterium]